MERYLGLLAYSLDSSAALMAASRSISAKATPTAPSLAKAKAVSRPMPLPTLAILEN